MSTLSGWCIEEKNYKAEDRVSLAEGRHISCKYVDCTCEGHTKDDDEEEEE